jgi:transcriptional regulator with XRE-family HTH domain
VDLRAAAGLSQQEVAMRINELAASLQGREGSVTANTVSRWERGVTTPAPAHRRLLATLFNLTVEQLSEHLVRVPLSEIPSEKKVSVPTQTAPQIDPRVAASQAEWRATRRRLNANRGQLVTVASSLYPTAVRLGDTGLLAPSHWIPREPVEIGRVALAYEPEAPEPVIDGTEGETSHVRPFATLARRFQRYTQAVRDLEHPKLFENKMCWRLLDVDWADHGGRMSYGPARYFAGVDINEAIAHETAYSYLTEAGDLRAAKPTMRDLPFRHYLGDPFDTARRPILAAISTLTIRNGREGPTFLLHRRDAQNVASAGGMLQVIPSGMFQPSSVMPGAQEADFDLWRNIMREYSEELLGNPEHDGDGAPVRYDSEPFQSLGTAVADGRVRVYCLGVALDALTLFGEVLTVAIFDSDFFDECAGDFVDLNDEGAVVDGLFPFTTSAVDQLVASGKIAPAGAGCLRLASRHADLCKVSVSEPTSRTGVK